MVMLSPKTRIILNSLFYAVMVFICNASAVDSASVNSEDLDSASNVFPWKSMRLPDHVVPLHYDLLLHPNLTTLTFSGITKITIRVTKQTGFVILHSKNLEITKTRIERKLGNNLVPRELLLLKQPIHEQIALLSADPLTTGENYTLYIEYNANLSNSFRGFYKSTYKTQDGDIRVLASTQFEPTAARMAFPCFDEPAFKASYSIKIRREPRHHALSNMPIVKSVNIGGGLIEDHFDVSVKMSTYLVAFIVSDFKSISQVTSRGVKISVYTVPEKIDQAAYALEAAVKLLEFYEAYFSIPYPLPKQDLAAIPDFQSGAMENWGLTTYRESALLYDPKRSSASSKLWVTMVIAHELAHQWFGNLVTMYWWNDLWLNEGFAKFMEYISVLDTYPELQVEDYFLNKCFGAMESDSLNSSHAISTPVENPAEIQEMFDDVSYDKGSCILNMLRDYIGPESFRAGIVKYLRHYSYRNARNEDLWNSMTDICPSDKNEAEDHNENQFCSRNKQTNHWSEGDVIDVKSMMNTWTLQKGFPLVTVTVKGKYVYLQQEHYQKGSNTSEPSGLLWHIPLTYVTSKSNRIQRFLLKTQKDVIVLPEEIKWIKFNLGMNGYYIVHYEGDGWDALIKLLKENHTAIGGNDRASLINNAFQLVSIGRIPIDKALSLTLYLKQENKIMPVFQGFHELVPMYKLMEKRDMKEVENQTKRYILNLFHNLIDAQSWTDEGTVSERMLRSHLLVFACIRKYQPCVDKAEKLFKEWQESGGRISLPSDVAFAVYSVGAQKSEGWDFLFEQYKRSLTSSIMYQIEAALTLSSDKQKLQRLMEEALIGDHIKTQELPGIVVSVSRNPYGYKLAWDFFKKNWQEFVQKFELGSRTIGDMLQGVVRDYSTREQLKQVTDFFDALSDGSQLRCVQQARETIEENIRWMDKNLELVKMWLKNNS
ncbi:endoplasmic reticulum aminopeptidase 1 [Bombina bombina]|uniref:endoplasmic reticulum aminopeptidase 1 n=1 Tax=Bombina bombina TaxID=8345 RepID=UPI00235AC28A|nr:endoplasmic reticulum aminopeptidase 1 [Bombina bombina]XP_053557485.1 endoplasmic reticulum aminopeptidase 1 [Bombina bombina]